MGSLGRGHLWLWGAHINGEDTGSLSNRPSAFPTLLHREGRKRQPEFPNQMEEPRHGSMERRLSTPWQREHSTG